MKAKLKQLQPTSLLLLLAKMPLPAANNSWTNQWKVSNKDFTQGLFYDQGVTEASTCCFDSNNSKHKKKSGTKQHPLYQSPDQFSWENIVLLLCWIKST